MIVLQTAGLFLFWAFLSGKWDVSHLLFGFFSALLIAKTGLGTAGSSKENKTYSLSITQLPGIFLRALLYSLWLLKSIFFAALHVSKIILSPQMPMAPKLIRHKTVLRNPAEQVIFANSITLTPGTITVDLGENELLIHELDEASAGDIVNGAMEAEIKKIMGPAAK